MGARRDRLPVRGILLDKDGTLIDCDATWGPVIQHLVAEFAPLGDAAALMDAAGLDPATGRLRAGSVWAAGSTHDLVRLWWPEAGRDEILRTAARIDAACAERSAHSAVPLLDLDRFLQDLSDRGLTVGIATNDSLASLNAFIDRHELAGRIDHRFGYDSVVQPKPDGDMVHAFCAAASLEPAEVAVVGDNTHDLEMARAAGAGWAVGVLTGNGGREDLEPLADVILNGVADLTEWLSGLPQSGISTSRP